jgi:hypothetical protein
MSHPEPSPSPLRVIDNNSFIDNSKKGIMKQFLIIFSLFNGGMKKESHKWWTWKGKEVLDAQKGSKKKLTKQNVTKCDGT